MAPENGPRTGWAADVAGHRDVGESERGDMTRLRVTVPPVVSVPCIGPLIQAVGAPLGAQLPDDADTER